VLADLIFTAAAIESYPREIAAHLALSAHAKLMGDDPSGKSVTPEALTTLVQEMVGQDNEVPELDVAVGEM
jgi:hypothetical protein